MTRLTPPFRRATSHDAVHMAELVNFAGEGLPVYAWGKLARPGQSAWDVGRERARNGIGGFAYQNTVVREEQGKVAACLIGYPLVSSPKLPGEEVLAPLVPLQELQDMVPMTWYLNTLATYPEHRGKGFGTQLLRIAETLARDSQNERISLITFDTNAGARRLYERTGYVEQATRPIAKGDWDHPGQNWVLLVKNV